MNFTIETNLLAVAGITLLAVVSPGPDFAVILRNVLRSGRGPGLATALGIGCGVVVHVTYTLLGLGWLVARYAWLLTAVKYAGAAYLVWLGCSALLSRGDEPGRPQVPAPGVRADLRQAFRNGFLCNVLNPKTVLFFIALFTQVVAPGTPRIALVGIGAYIVLTHLAWFAFVVLVLTNPAALRVFNHWRRAVERGVGGCLVALGVTLAIDN
ncbi:Threonine efflux protein [Pseudodesulfovibrio hydrargyri]|uniref:Threonine efflux protein n=1 Tax=Pseudodesulfovibrio hydrargyri TaxID=2125990 RepID=A0A1J5NFB7_9BACT|nr:LysE family translocator [Pseudodesulfovibrio hydrargyri]OIQ50417.1 Threonine efflux protein [Pseudodesulfovibrio hydrargyri]